MLSVIVIILLILIDQLIKYLATVYLAPVNIIELIPGFIRLRYVLNDGAAFSLFSGSQFMLIVVTSIGLLLLLYWIYVKKPDSNLEKYALVMVFSGGVGNLINRIASGYVVDYIEPTFMNFAVFNFADCLVCIGAFLLVVAVFKQEWKAQKEKKEKENV